MQDLMKMIIPQGRFIFKAVLMIFFVAVTYLFFKDNGKKAKEKLFGLLKEPWLALFLICEAYILTCTIIGRYFTKPYVSVLGSFGFVNADGGLNADMCANVIMFIPYTFLYIKAFRPAVPWKACLVLSVGTTAILELSQLIGWLGNFQFADMVHNIIGGMIGCGIWYVIDRRVISRGYRWFSNKMKTKKMERD